MKIKLFTQKNIIIITSLIISSCNSSTSSISIPTVTNTNTPVPTTVPKTDECISSFEDFAYTADKNARNMPEPILPLSPWEIELEFPKDEFIYRVNNYREIDGNSEIWVHRINPIIPEPGNTGVDFIIYSPTTKEQTIIPAEIDDTGIYVDILFVNSVGEIWGRNKWLPYGEYPLKSVPILSKYNEETQRFEFDANSFETPLIQDDINFNDWADIFLDDNDVFWFFIPFDGLYSYLPDQ